MSAIRLSRAVGDGPRTHRAVNRLCHAGSGAGTEMKAAKCAGTSTFGQTDARTSCSYTTPREDHPPAQSNLPEAPAHVSGDLHTGVVRGWPVRSQPNTNAKAIASASASAKVIAVAAGTGRFFTCRPGIQAWRAPSSSPQGAGTNNARASTCPCNQCFISHTDAARRACFSRPRAAGRLPPPSPPLPRQRAGRRPRGRGGRGRCPRGRWRRTCG